MRGAAWFWIAVVASSVGAQPAPVCAEPEFPTSTLIGPLVGIAWNQEHKAHLTLGVEGGVGLYELAVLNAGSTWRGGELFSYIEMDAWLLLGATFGYGHGTRHGWQAVAGLWEVLPPKVLEDGCDEATIVAFSVGYRWTGLHELYITGKYGESWLPCFD